MTGNATQSNVSRVTLATTGARRANEIAAARICRNILPVEETTELSERWHLIS